MVFFNYATMEMSAKIVYYGPGLCGKTTNLQQIYNVTNPNTRGEMVSLATETDRTLFFDLLPIHLGTIGGFKTRFQLYTVPGQVFYNSTRKLVLKGVDAVVFVADSQEPMLDANMESLENLQENLADLNLSMDDIPWVIQYNKRDLPNILPVDELNYHLNKGGVPHFEAIAVTGKGVLETLKGVSKLTLLSLRKKTGEIDEEEEEDMRETEDEAVDFDVDDELGDEDLDLSDLSDEEISENTEEEFDAEALADDFSDDSEDDGGYQVSEEEFSDNGNGQEMAGVEVETELEVQEEEAPSAVTATAVKVGTVVKDVIQKITVPVILRKDESLKDVQIRLKLEVECIIKREA